MQVLEAARGLGLPQLICMLRPIRPKVKAISSPNRIFQ